MTITEGIFSAMDKREAETRITQLRREILEHRRLYYEEDAPSVSDFEYDMLERELASLEQLFPDLAEADSPTRTVGGRASEAFSPVAHPTPLLSLDNAFGEEEVVEWYGRLARVLEEEIPRGFVCELKLDGLSVTLRYRNGVLVQGATRGDGAVGE